MNGFYISTDKALLDIKVVSDYLSTRSYWAQGRSIDTIKKSIENSLCFGVYDTQNNQVGFARVVSDYAVFAWLLDVFILEEHQGKGLGKWLMSEITNHKSLQGLKRWGLNTKDAHGLYEKFGFKHLADPNLAMEKVQHIKL